MLYVHQYQIKKQIIFSIRQIYSVYILARIFGLFVAICTYVAVLCRGIKNIFDHKPIDIRMAFQFIPQ